MPLDYTEFSHHYDGLEFSDEDRQAHFAAVADFLESLVRLFWNQQGSSNPLGISFDGASLRLDAELDSKPSFITHQFNNAATSQVAGKQET